MSTERPRPWNNPTPLDGYEPDWAGQFDTYEDWVNHAHRALAGTPYSSGDFGQDDTGVRPICVDARGQRCTVGLDFARARDAGTFPIRYFWEMKAIRAPADANGLAAEPQSSEQDDDEALTAEIGAALTGILDAFTSEYETMNEEDLRARWYFKWDADASLEWNHYSFHDCLSLYARSCRRWETIHNGHRSVVERVRDKYLMPKIRDFMEQVRQATAASVQG